MFKSSLVVRFVAFHFGDVKKKHRCVDTMRDEKTDLSPLCAGYRGLGNKGDVLYSE